MSSHSFTSRRRALICAERAETSARICSCRAGSASASLVRSFRYRFFRCSVRLTSRASTSKHYGEWRAEQEGRPTYLSLIKADVDAAIRQSMTERQFFYRLRQMGYDIKVGKDITVRPYDRPHGRKLVRNLGEDYSLENIRKRILAQRRPQRVETPEPRRCRLLGDLKQARKVTGFRLSYA